MKSNTNSYPKSGTVNLSTKKNKKKNSEPCTLSHVGRQFTIWREWKISTIYSAIITSKVLSSSPARKVRKALIFYFFTIFFFVRQDKTILFKY